MALGWMEVDVTHLECSLILNACYGRRTEKYRSNSSITEWIIEEHVRIVKWNGLAHVRSHSLSAHGS